MDHFWNRVDLMGAAQQALVAGGIAGPNAHAASVLASLVAWWDFEENDGGTQFFDSHGSNDLTIRTGGSTTASSAVTGTGRVNRGFTPGLTADRTAYIPRSNTALDLPNSDWSFGGWVVGEPVSGWSAFLLNRLGSGSGTYQAYLQIDSTNTRYQFGASTDGSSLTTVDSGVVANITNARLVVCTLDRTNNLIRIRVRGPSANANVTASFAGALYTGSTAANFCINDALSSDSTFFSGDRQMTGGYYDSCFYAAKAISDDEFTYLYNAGSGVDYSTLVADAT